MSDGIHLDGEGPAGDPDDSSYFEEPYENDFGRQIEKTNSFRRIFYRNENSIRVNGGELEAGKSKYAFYGVTLPSEYNTVSPWISLREMEAMVFGDFPCLAPFLTLDRMDPLQRKAVAGAKGDHHRPWHGL